MLDFEVNMTSGVKTNAENGFPVPKLVKNDILFVNIAQLLKQANQWIRTAPRNAPD